MKRKFTNAKLLATLICAFSAASLFGQNMSNEKPQPGLLTDPVNETRTEQLTPLQKGAGSRIGGLDVHVSKKDDGPENSLKLRNSGLLVNTEEEIAKQNALPATTTNAIVTEPKIKEND